MTARGLAVALTLLLGVGVPGEAGVPPTLRADTARRVPADPSLPAASGVEEGSPGPTGVWVAFRLFVASAAVTALIGLAFLGDGWLVWRVDPAIPTGRGRGWGRRRPRWLSGWLVPSATVADQVRILARSQVRPRQWILLVQVGCERFLVGVTGTQVTLLSRLETGAALAGLVSLSAEPGPGELAAAARPAEPVATDFAQEFRVASAQAAAERAIRTALARPRERRWRGGPLMPLPGGPGA